MMSASESVPPWATYSSNSGSVAAGLRLRVCDSVLSCSQTPTASTMMKRSLERALGVTTRSLSGEMMRTPRPFICSKKPADLTLRIKKTHSIGLTSVPVEIMSTVTAMRG